jgi:hypothetical protein
VHYGAHDGGDHARREVFARAFLDGVCPALVAVLVMVAPGAVITLGLRGGRTAQEARLQPAGTLLKRAS